MILRDYQQDAIDATYAALARGIMRPLVVMPTGSGKSLVCAEFIRSAVSDNGAKKVVVLVDSKELVRQNEQELKAIWPHARTGIYSAGLNRRDLHDPIVFAGIQSIYRKAYKLGKIDIIVVDEAHMVPRDSMTRYGQFLREATTANPNVVILGLTATPFRLDSGLLTSGQDALFDEIVYDTDILKLIEDGYLCSVVSKGSAHKINLDGVHTRMGDYAPGELELAADDDKLVRGAVDEIVMYGKDRESWLIFCAGIKHANHVLDEIRSRCVVAELVTGTTENKKRDRIVDQFKRREIRCLVNVGCFCKGFNAPCVDLLALMTATKSCGKYVQMVGRAMRTCPGKENALILDYGKNIETHGPIDEVTPPEHKTKGEGDGVAPCKECPQCFSILPASVRYCPECFYEFEQKPAHEAEAYDGAVLSKDETPKLYHVDAMGAYRHKKAGKPDSIRLEFHVLERNEPFNHYLTLDHGGFAAKKALQYVQAAGGRATTVDDALKEYFAWRDPVKIWVKKNGKFRNIVQFEFPDDNTQQQTF